MNKEKLHDLYWDKRSAKMDVDEKVFKFQEKRNLVSVLADNLEKYFKRTKIHFQNAACKPLKDFIETGKKNNFNSIKFRERLGGLINHSPLEFDYLLMKDVFLNSMHFESPILSLSGQGPDLRIQQSSGEARTDFVQGLSRGPSWYYHRRTWRDLHLGETGREGFDLRDHHGL